MTLSDLPAALFLSIAANASHFPAYIKSRGRSYVAEGRVGPLEIEPDLVRAAVRGTQTYRTAWRWDRGHADPVCSCPVGPVCKHAFALARVIEEARDPTLTSWRRPAAPAPAWERRREGVYRAEPRLESELTEWARQRTGTPARAVRIVMGLDLENAREPFVWIEVRVTTPRRGDGPRTARQLIGLASELRSDPTLLAPPQARLLRLVTKILQSAPYFFEGTRFELEASAIHRLLDSFSGSALVTWSDDVAHAEATAGERLRADETSVDIVPVCTGEGDDLRIRLAARWPDGRERLLDDVVHLPSDDALQPGLVLAEGAFWRVADEPSPQLLRRFADEGSLRVPAAGRERFLQLLASSFSSVADALAPHIRVYPTRPVVTLDLHDDDWIEVRLFAHTGDDSWRPGGEAHGAVAFERTPDGQWVRFRPQARDDAAERRASLTEEPSAAEAAGVPDATASPASEDPAAGADAANPAATWIEMPDAAAVEPAVAWLGRLPLARRALVQDLAPGYARGDLISLGTKTLEAFGDAWEARPRDVTYLGNEAMRRLLGRRVVRARVRVTPSDVDWLTVSAEWEAEGQTLTDEDLSKLRAARTPFVRLGSGWVRRDAAAAPDAMADALADLGIEPGAGAQRVSVMQLAQARPESLAALTELSGDASTVAEVERLRERIRSFRGVPRVDVPEPLGSALRPYQQDGLDMLAFITDLGLGPLLADDMGLGKTIQALAWIEWLRQRDPDGGPTLVVCPASVVHNWQREAERFTPHLKVLVLGSGRERHALRSEIPSHDLIVTNYALLRRDLEAWRTVRLRAAILDEAQTIKNPDAAVTRAVLELDVRHRLALTGTPLENRALDLWSIMQFLNPGYLGPRKVFAAHFDDPHAPSYRRRVLAARLRPVMVRRLKEQVAEDLPDRIEERRDCAMTPGQRKLYLDALMKGRQALERFAASDTEVKRHTIDILAVLTRLRQACCHPALVGGREDLGSGKFDTLFELLEPLLAEGRKVLVFSQFVRCLELLRAEMERRSIRHHMLTGATTKRERVVQAFETDPEPCVFLVSLKAGGVGLNLVAASYVVLFDPWWNPAVEAQAIDRAHRIGQTRTVIAYRLIASGTIEDKIWELQQRKAALVAGVLGEDGFARALTKRDLEFLLE